MSAPHAVPWQVLLGLEPLDAAARANLLARWAAYATAARAYATLDAQGLDADGRAVRRVWQDRQDALDLLEWRVPDAPRLLATLAAAEQENARLRAEIGRLATYAKRAPVSLAAIFPPEEAAALQGVQDAYTDLARRLRALLAEG